jgi:GAF domain-containing protein
LSILSNSISYYNWVDFTCDTKTLHLGPYVRAETDHTVIPLEKGICGQVAVSNENFVVPDVKAQDNYQLVVLLKSEIVCTTL